MKMSKLKRQAEILSKECGLPHSKALELASKLNGFKNFHQAQKELENASESLGGEGAILTENKPIQDSLSPIKKFSKCRDTWKNLIAGQYDLTQAGERKPHPAQMAYPKRPRPAVGGPKGEGERTLYLVPVIFETSGHIEVEAGSPEEAIVLAKKKWDGPDCIEDRTFDVDFAFGDNPDLVEDVAEADQD